MTGERRLGEALPGWRVPPRPGPDRIAGRWAVLERLDPALHAGDIHAANTADDAMKLLFYGEMMAFMVVLFIGLIYVWKKGILEWNR